MNKIKEYTEKIFEDIKHIDETGNEYWLARELQKTLEYKEWRNFKKVIDIAKQSCKTSINGIPNHFVEINKMIIIGKGGKRKQLDYKLSRYACYLIVQNGDPRKEVIALAQTYFAIQTRKQELQEELIENEKRLMRRQDLTRANKNLNGVAKVSGVKNYGKFINEGYKGLYNGETADDIRKRKKLGKYQNISDYMGSVELGANIFRATQTEDKLRREKIVGDIEAGEVHYEIGKKVRKAIKDMGGTMPEDLETPKKSIKEIQVTSKKTTIK